MRVLAIETSCDETSAAVVRTEREAGPLAHGDPVAESVVILSQDIHKVFGGVVPELASRAHLTALPAVIDQALAEANTTLDAVDAIVATQGPGLVGALLVGAMYGKGLAWTLGKPFLGVHHMEGHLFAAALADKTLAPPFVGLLVSGGHTQLLDVPEWGRYRIVGATKDDAAGEAFDKVGTLLGMPYPGGPKIEKLAKEGRPGRFKFPRPMLGELGRSGPDEYAFSFSGLKTAVLRAVQGSKDLEADRADLCRDFQDAAIEVLTEKTAHLTEALGYPTVVVGGGVASNQTLLAALRQRLEGTARVLAGSLRLNQDNAAMIGAAGAWRMLRGERSGWDLEPRADLPMPGLVVGR
ncbi:MAG TPA: tRNA (adenosine(37)-N6)-threonylcarbamoyltransferase complex transferase subunit TsaD [Gemmatimonadales bacterium]|nr:tRNA (adenosine(37)-N6)-threonylcarbamoyltransferase complex transferase subunit TsaD [Gemmatimonadales bacterium]